MKHFNKTKFGSLDMSKPMNILLASTYLYSCYFLLSASNQGCTRQLDPLLWYTNVHQNQHDNHQAMLHAGICD